MNQRADIGSSRRPSGWQVRRWRRPWFEALLIYVVVFGTLAWPWLKVADRAIPSGLEVASAGDARDHVWILATVAKAIASSPAHLFDAPIFYPALNQLTGAEPFLSSQLVFAPGFFGTGNALFAASVVAWVSYPAAALAMDRLLVALGCVERVAWVGGLAFGLGPLRVPANFQLFQYLNVYLPLVALAITRLRMRPTRSGAVVLAVVLSLGLLSGYYLALMLLVTALTWGLAEVSRPLASRGSFATFAFIAALSATLLLLASSTPYLHSSETWGGMLAPLRTREGATAAWDTAIHAATLESTVTYVLALGGALALTSRAGPANAIALRGILLAVVAFAFMVGPIQYIGDLGIRMPLDLIPGGMGNFFRVPWRFVVVLGFGTALLASAFLELIVRRLSFYAGLAACTLAALALIAFRGTELPGIWLDEVAAQKEPIYERVREVALARGPGPLLELPLPSGLPESFAESMVASIRHEQPLILGYSSYMPRHRHLLLTTISRLLATGEGTDDLVDMTHLRWILLRPLKEWPRPQEREVIANLAELTPVLSRDGWDLLRVDLEPSHSKWFEAIRQPRPETSVLGTPLRPLTDPRGHLRALSIPAVVRPDYFEVAVTVENSGSEDWPATKPLPNASPELLVRLAARIVTRAPETPEQIVWDGRIPLDRDLPASETLRMHLLLPTPSHSGNYTLRLWLQQLSGAGFDPRTSPPLEIPIRVDS